MNDLRKASHTTYELKYHFVWIVKYRKDLLFREKLAKKLKEIVKGIGERYWFEVDTMGTDGNHFHLFVGAAPR